MTKQMNEAAATKARAWSAKDEAIKVAIGMRVGLTKGLSRTDSILMGQRLLPKHRRLDPKKDKLRLKNLASPKNPLMNGALKRLSLMSREQILALVPQAEPLLGVEPAVPDDEIYVPMRNTPLTPVEYPARVGADGRQRRKQGWPDLYLAAMRRRIQFWLDRGSDAPMNRLVMEAQDIECPPDDRRPRASLHSSGPGGQTLTKYLERGKDLQHLLADIPFDPRRRHWIEPEPPKAEPEPQAAAPQEAPQPAEAPTPAPAAESAPVAPPEPLPEPVAALSPPPPAATDVPQGPPPSITGNPAAHRLALGFAETLARNVVSGAEVMLDGMMEQVRSEIRSGHEQLLTEFLQKFDRLLGGTGNLPPVDQQPPPQAQESAAPPGQEEPPPAAQVQHIEVDPSRFVRVDILGVDQGYQKMLLQRKLNGHWGQLDVRFIEQSERYYTPQPDREIILVQGKVPYDVCRRINKFGRKPLKVQRTVEDLAAGVTSLLTRSSE